MVRTLIIPDCHASPDDKDMTRFLALGNLIAVQKPDNIVCLGDFADMPSLCSYDKGTRGYEGRRYKRDILAARTAMELVLGPLYQLQNKQRNNKDKIYKPNLNMCLGNHEDRINRVTKYEAILDGVVSTEDLGYELAGWNVSPYMEPIIDMALGIAYSHAFSSGLMNRPISGEHPAYSLVTKQLMSCVAGHSHLRDFCERTNAKGDRIFGLFAGCYVDSKQDYAGESQKMWWSGLTMLSSEGSLSFMPIDEVKRRYLPKDVQG